MKYFVCFIALLSIVIASQAAMISKPLSVVPSHRGPLEGVDETGKRYYQDPLRSASTIYAAPLTIGNQDYRLILDTGSGAIYITGRNCTLSGTSTGCQFATNFYTGTNFVTYNGMNCISSITYNGVSGRCGYSSTYADGSHVDAVVMSDTASIGSYSGTIQLGMLYSATSGFILDGTDGIWGLYARHTTSYIELTGPMEVWGNAGLNPMIFAVCLTSTGGDLHIGGIDTSFAQSGLIVYEPFNTASYNYEIQLSSIKVAGNTVAFSSSTPYIVLDTGSTKSYLNTTIFNNWVSAIQTACATCDMRPFTSIGNCYQVTPSNYPTMTMTFQSVTLTFPGTAYLVPLSGFAGYYCSAFYPSSFATGSGMIGLMGDTLLPNFYTVFNISGGTIGFGNLNTAKCTGLLPPTAPLSNVSPGLAKPPTTNQAYVTPISPSTAPASVPVAPAPVPVPVSPAPAPVPHAPAPAPVPHAPAPAPVPVTPPVPVPVPVSPAPTPTPAPISPSPVSTPITPVTPPVPIAVPIVPVPVTPPVFGGVPPDTPSSANTLSGLFSVLLTVLLVVFVQL